MPGTGVSGMRERANLIHASLSISEAAEGGTIVRLILPRSEEPRGD
jgi:signal transduction histidine kinase